MNRYQKKETKKKNTREPDSVFEVLVTCYLSSNTDSER